MEFKLKQYPSGFLGNPNLKQTDIDHSRTAKKMINQILSKPDTSDADSIHTSSQEINDIWKEVLANTPDYKTFDFKERILKFALTAFGTEYFLEWVSTQNQNPNFSELHQKFIDDTINFIYYDKRREYTINNWLTLLDDSKDNQKTDKLSNIQKVFFLQPNPHKGADVNMSSLTIKELIGDWVRKESGMEDLTSSLFVLFGDR